MVFVLIEFKRKAEYKRKDLLSNNKNRRFLKLESQLLLQRKTNCNRKDSGK